MKKLIINKAQCRICGDIIVSEHVHDFKTCSCGEISVDGGNQYIRRCATLSLDNVIELSEYEGGDEECESISKEIKECATRTGVILEQNISNMQDIKKKRSYRPEFWAELPNGVRTCYGINAHSVAELEANYRIQKEREFRNTTLEIVKKHIGALKELAKCSDQ